MLAPHLHARRRAPQAQGRSGTDARQLRTWRRAIPRIVLGPDVLKRTVFKTVSVLLVVRERKTLDRGLMLQIIRALTADRAPLDGTMATTVESSWILCNTPRDCTPHTKLTGSGYSPLNTFSSKSFL